MKLEIEWGNDSLKNNKDFSFLFEKIADLLSKEESLDLKNGSYNVSLWDDGDPNKGPIDEAWV